MVITCRSGHNEAEFCRNDDAVDGLIVAREDGPRSGQFTLTNDALEPKEIQEKNITASVDLGINITNKNYLILRNEPLVS